jgi:exonuclease SbcD
VLTEWLTAARASLRSPRSIALAHTFAAGGLTSDSERDLAVGGVDAVALEAFAGFSYVGLGHLHRPRDLGGGVRYCGSPLAYSFAETERKHVIIVDLPTDGSVVQRVVPSDVRRDVVTLTGSVDDLLAATGPKAVAAETAWVRANLTDTVPAVEPMVRLRHRYPYLVEVRRDLPRTDDRVVAVRGADVARTNPAELAVRFYRDVIGVDAPAEVVALVADVVASVGSGDPR